MCVDIHAHSCHCKPKSSVAIQSESLLFGTPGRSCRIHDGLAGLPPHDDVLPRNDMEGLERRIERYKVVFGNESCRPAGCF